MNKTDTPVKDSLSDNEIIAKILAGDKDLYAVLVRRFNQRLYRVGMSIINDDAEVEDIMQVTYINAYTNLSKFSYRSGFSTWLTKILINETLLRLKKRRKFTYMDYDILNKETFQQEPGQVRSPADTVLHAELKTKLDGAVKQLPEIYRTVFILREIEEMSIAETRECLGISEVNVKVRLNRAKSLLKKSLGEFYQKEDLLLFHLTRCNRMVEYVMQEIKILQPH
jgi:RNA polymerase sigma factor (sigma-70 family)